MELLQQRMKERTMSTGGGSSPGTVPLPIINFPDRLLTIDLLIEMRWVNKGSRKQWIVGG